MSAGWVWVVGAAGVGLAAVPVTVVAGLRLLGVSPLPRPGPVLGLSAAAGALAGVVAGVVALRAGSWWWLPAMLVWSVSLTAGAVCDAWTQRIPTSLVYIGAGITAAFLVVASALTGEWSAVWASLVASVVAGLWFLLYWRFGGMGFGDVRLAVLGGLGLGHTSYRAVLLGLIVFMVVVATQGVFTYVRTRDRRTQIPFGPALAIGFLVAAVG